MTLSAGTRLGPYEVQTSIGAGGMGEVYRARDTRLDRTVAIKVLSAELASDPQFRERFEREAKVISSLEHPHICALYDVGRDQGIDFLVMQHLEGETLADRLAKGPLPLDHALAVAVQLAEALDAAHRRGIVHRDLKPGNVMLTKTGAARHGSPQATLLDFGLARTGMAAAAAGATAAPTETAPLTARGSILGTFQYMAPEQLDGKEADARTDIFALGVVLYEMVTGRRAFEGKSYASLIAAILEKEPPPISTVQPVSPPALDLVVRSCMAKDPDARFQSAHDLALQLRWIAEGGLSAATPAAARARRATRERVAWTVAVAGVLAATGLAYFALRRPAGDAVPVRFSVSPPKEAVFGPTGATVAPFPAISPDGRHVAFLAQAANDPVQRLFIRSMDELEARPLRGTEGAAQPFWSPDSRYVGFFAEDKLKKIDIVGGPPQTLCNAASPEGGTWSRDGVVLFTADQAKGLYRVSEAGGEPSLVIAPNSVRQENSYRWPWFLPDGRRFLFQQETSVFLGSLDSSETRRLVPSDSKAIYASGYLLFVRETALMAQRFDAGRGEVTGDAFPVVVSVRTGINGRAAFSASETGALVYRTGESAIQRRLTWVDRNGKVLEAVAESGNFLNLALSPDGHRLAVRRVESPAESDIWLLDLVRGTFSRFTFGAGVDEHPVWSPDGKSIAFAHYDAGSSRYTVLRKLASGTGAEETLATVGAGLPHSWSPDGRVLTFAQDSDLWVLPLDGDRKPVAFVRSSSDQSVERISPDGHWIAYHSNESGTTQVYVQSFPMGQGKWQISTNAGSYSLWRGDGRELFYLGPPPGFEMMAVEVRAEGSRFEAGIPRALFKTGFRALAPEIYAAARDGQRFLLSLPLDEAAAGAEPLTVVLNWTAGLKR